MDCVLELEYDDQFWMIVIDSTEIVWAFKSIRICTINEYSEDIKRFLDKKTINALERLTDEKVFKQHAKSISGVH